MYSYNVKMVRVVSSENLQVRELTVKALSIEKAGKIATEKFYEEIKNEKIPVFIRITKIELCPHCESKWILSKVDIFKYN